MGTVQQDVFLFSATIRDNIAYGAVEATQEASRRRRAAYIHDSSRGCGRVRHVGRERGITLGRAEAANRDCADASADPHTDTGRLDVERGHGDGVPDPQTLAKLMENRTTFVIAAAAGP